MTHIIRWVSHQWAKQRLLGKYRQEIAVDEILEEWIKACIIERKHEGRRQELVELQKKIKEEKLFYSWLRQR